MRIPMKERKHIFFVWLAIWALALTGCVEPVSESTINNQGLVHICFQVKTENNGISTKSDLISGDDVIVTSLFMYCFDANGRFLGRYPTKTLAENKEESTQNPVFAENTFGFTGDVPPATARIHFVANADIPVGNDHLGLTELEIMNNPDIGICRSVTEPTAYWGYVKREDAETLMSAFKNGSIPAIPLLRDRLRIDGGTCADYQHIVKGSIKWVIYDGLNHSFIAPKSNTSQNNPDSPYSEVTYDDSFFPTSTMATPYPDGVRIDPNIHYPNRFATALGDMVDFEQKITVDNAEVDNPNYSPLFAFDDAVSSDPFKTTRIIVRVLIKGERYNSDPTDTKERFFPLCFTKDDSDDQIPLMRGHRYVMNLSYLPEIMGYDTFQKAADANSFANGQLINIEQEVIEVSDGEFNLKVKYILGEDERVSTTVLVQDENAKSVDVPFLLSKLTDDVTAHPARQFYFTKSDWEEQEPGTTAVYSYNSTLPVSDNNKRDATWEQEKIKTVTENNETEYKSVAVSKANPLDTKVTLPLSAGVNEHLKQSLFKIYSYYQTTETVGSTTRTKNHVLMRNIEVYTITEFKLQEAYTSDYSNADHNLELKPIANRPGEYQLRFTLPSGSTASGDHDKYPSGLYPMNIKIASKTLQPTMITSGASVSSNLFGVQVKKTHDGNYGVNAQTSDPDKWNYQSPSKYWDYWYSYAITSVPKDANGKEIEGPEVIINFKDVRGPNYDEDNRPEDVGLYLYIEFFGDAKEVSYEGPYQAVPVRGVTISAENPAAGQEDNGHDADHRYSIARSTNQTTRTLQLIATVNPDYATNKSVTWSSSKTARATVNSNGLVTITNAGTGGTAGRIVNITATTADGSKTDTFYIWVTD